MEKKKEKKNTNTKLWDLVCKTDPSTTKGAKIGQMKITAIDPQSQRKKATEVFGPYGIGWGIVPESEKFEFNTFEGTTLVSYFARLFYIFDGTQGEIPINAVIKAVYMTQGYENKPGYLKIDDEYTKKVQTNALTKGLSTIGFNSDVFEGKFDDCKYVQQMKKEFSGDPAKPADVTQEKPADNSATLEPAPVEWAKKNEAVKKQCKAFKLSEAQVKEAVLANNYDALKVIQYIAQLYGTPEKPQSTDLI